MPVFIILIFYRQKGCDIYLSSNRLKTSDCSDIVLVHLAALSGLMIVTLSTRAQCSVEYFNPLQVCPCSKYRENKSIKSFIKESECPQYTRSHSVKQHLCLEQVLTTRLKSRKSFSIMKFINKDQSSNTYLLFERRVTRYLTC